MPADSRVQSRISRRVRLTTGVADTGNNAVDFYFVDTNGTSAGAGQRLGSPGPENLASPIQRNASFAVGLPDICVAGSLPPNQIRDLTSVPAQNSTFGTIELRRAVVNNTGANVTRLRFRVTQQTTFPAPSGTADLRTRTTADTTDNFSNHTLRDWYLCHYRSGYDAGATTLAAKWWRI